MKQAPLSVVNATWIAFGYSRRLRRQKGQSSDQVSIPAMAASVRRNISFPVLPPFHHGACKRRQSTTDQSSITPSSTAATPSPPPFSGLPLSAIPTKPSPGKLAAAPNPHRRPSPHPLSRRFVLRWLSSAGLLTGTPLAPRRHPKPSPKAALPVNPRAGHSDGIGSPADRQRRQAHD